MKQPRRKTTGRVVLDRLEPCIARQPGIAPDGLADLFPEADFDRGGKASMF
jgi:hypothetical protein